MNVRKHSTRPGTVLPMTAICMVALVGFVALAIDLGMLVVVRTDCQNAADAASLLGVRYLDNKTSSTNNNSQAAVQSAWTVVRGNKNVTSTFGDSNIYESKVGVYDYDSTAGKFNPGSWSTSMTPSGGTPDPGAPPNGKSWSTLSITVNGSQNAFFSKIFGVTSLSTGATAVAVHRPRDTAMVLDFTGSMGNATYAVLGSNFLNDPNSVYPKFGHYARWDNWNYANFAASSLTNNPPTARTHLFRQTTQLVSGGYVYSPANLTIETYNGTAMVRDFWYDPSNDANLTSTVASTSQTNLVPAFHYSFPESGGDPTNLVGPTYDFTGYKTDGTGTNGKVNYPAPDNYADQSNTTAGGVSMPYAGDRTPRKYGKSHGAYLNNTWDPADANGTAINVAEFLGWTSKYTTGSTIPTNNTAPAGSTTTAGLSTTRAWTNFRDAAWERYGYDLDVEDYVNNRPSTWNPRWDWNIATSQWMHSGAATSPPATAWRPKLRTNGSFLGYQMGPMYYGKTFLLWPPDPRYTQGKDWRNQFFSTTTNSTILNTGVNTMLKNSVTPNYTNILSWLKSGPRVFPGNLRSGRVLYYSSIPNDVTTSGSSDADKDKVFWKAYIDFVLKSTTTYFEYDRNGWPENATGSTKVAPTVSSTALTGYVDGTITPNPSADPAPYMNYLDNPPRPVMEGWFGPLTMLAFLDNYNYWSGSTHQAQCWQLKAGVNSVLDDVRNNHPNDYCGLAFFTTNQYTSMMIPIGQDYQSMKNALFYPRNLLTTLAATPTSTTEWRPYDTGGLSGTNGIIPNAQSTTDPVSGMVFAYNMLTSSPDGNIDGYFYTTTSKPPASRRGRRGASKIIVFETDGIPNSSPAYTLQKKGYDSYYTNGGSSLGAADTAAVAVVQQIVKTQASTNTSGTDSGLSMSNSPARVFAIGFGDIFSTSSAATASTFLLNVQKAGNTSASGDSAIPSYQIITGPYQTRIDNLKDALQRIFQSGVQVTLIQ